MPKTIKKYQREALAEIYTEWEKLGEDIAMSGMIITLDVIGYRVRQEPIGVYSVVKKREQDHV